jgi:hypothetical protein
MMEAKKLGKASLNHCLFYFFINKVLLEEKFIPCEGLTISHMKENSR